ncbi:MAG: wax ester/triacylglycerol synthase family O-acyltransferase [Acidimicrobiales bacterium]|nr:wax ester/triacylglycerol synthase family O-acyltransferase [Acidimicrobiales bacterium]MCB1017293.1 wax ester/triacylglycerol synthase family O-acyltransferase [Acidimicrobiales bacterium]
MSLDRLSGQDALFLQVEAPNQPMHVGGVAVFEGAPFHDDDGRFRIDDLRDAITARLHLVPRFRRKLRWVPFDQGHPVWVDDPDFDVADHVRCERLPEPGGWPELRHLVERLEAVPLRRDRPLWELWFVEGLEGGRVALVQKTHHALIDGISGIDVATVLLDLEPDPPSVEAPEWEPDPPPSDAELLVDGVAGRLRGPAAWLQSAAGALRHPEQTGERVLESAVDAGRALLSAGRPPPPTPWNVPIGPTRRYEVARVPLDRVKETKAAVDASVNDVVLAICAGALRAFLLHRGEPVPGGRTLRTFVPVSLRREDQRYSYGNRVSGLLAELPVGEPDPAARLREVCAQMAAVKRSGQAEVADQVLAVADLAPPAMVGFAARLIVRQRTVNLGITNVPGPQVPLYCMGARLLEVFPYVGVFERTGLLLGLISYCGQLGFGLTADGASMPDLDVLARAVEHEADVLHDAVVTTP